jgi:hypothetical protein
MVNIMKEILPHIQDEWMGLGGCWSDMEEKNLLVI